MLKKLLKYEFRSTYREIGIIFLIFAGITVLSLVVLISTNINNRYGLDSLVSINIFASIFIGSILIVTSSAIIIIRTIWTGLFGKSAYLLFSIPATTKQIVISKILIYLFWTVIQVVIVIFTVFLYLTVLAIKTDSFFDVFASISYSLNNFFSTYWFFIIDIIIGTLGSIMLYLGVSVFVHTFYKGQKKVALAIAIIFVYSFITSLIFPNPFFAIMIGGNANTRSIYSLIHILLQIGIIIGSFYFSSKSLDKKLDI
jgi:hypothetical protein